MGAEAVNPEKIIEAVAVDNLKAVAGQPAVLANMALQNAVANQQGMSAIFAICTGKLIEAIIGTSPGEGGFDVAALQQLMKGAQTTPPPTP